MKAALRILPALLLLASTPFARAADAVNTGQDKATMSSPPVMLGQVFLGLLFVVAMILLLAWLLKKLGHGGHAQGKAMNVIAAMPLGTREKAVLVQVGEKQLLLGVAPGRVNCLHTFDEPVVTPPAGEHSAAGGDFSARFKEALAQRLGRS